MERIAVISAARRELRTFQASTEKTRLGCSRSRRIVTICFRSSLTYLRCRRAVDGRADGAVYSGVYVAAVVNLDERVLVTDDGRVPMVDVDDTASVSDASLMSDYYWLLKVG